MAEYVTNFKIGDRIIDIKDAALTPVVADNTAKITGKLIFDTPEYHGAIGNGIIDDSASLQEMLDGGNKSILMSAGKKYYAGVTLRIEADTVIDLNGAELIAGVNRILCNWYPDELLTGYNGKGNITIKNGTISGGCLSFIHADNVRLENVNFKNCNNDHFLEICACNNYLINNCSFVGMKDRAVAVLEYVNIDHCTAENFPGFTQLATYDGTPNNNITVSNCRFELGSGEYAFGEDAFGVHSPLGTATLNHTNIKFINNTVKGFTAYGIRIHCMDNVQVANNVIDVPTYAIELGNWAVCNNVQITGNDFLNAGTGSDTFYLLMRPYGVLKLGVLNNTYASARNTRYYRYFDKNSQLSLTAFEGITYAAADGIRFPLTAFNTIKVQSGYTANNTLHTAIIKSYTGQGFNVGETYMVPRINNDANAVILGTMVVTDEYTLTFTGIGARFVTLAKE